MQYLTKSFHTKFKVPNDIDTSKSDFKGCVKKLNKWLAKSSQQDVKVDDFNFTMERTTDYNGENIKIDYNDEVTYQYPEMVCTKLVIVYHHE